ncbi:uncharacterized protein MYCFIDRAFT_211732 [Pseudocercospora fijiensis CIRAD86]|uniref:Uncharacterized protein n=1 Tax=Pseudocercospora fijiensis (strain CIRAD86) TaxID=383855 RepID=M3A8R8_PSEFD|nr:uncharacterized protein MYCFIDRAFT_211732 [Pseudocercospora fijiensis CIRAD86]EME81021.1 hypothetical protein MYCFIDRAFT_211732 [Pseudocercospora fijiensis CIRAD86]
MLSYLLGNRKRSSWPSNASEHPEKREEVSSSPAKRLKPTERTPGTWEAVDWQRPKASPYPGWSVTDTAPLPYRPFRWGPYRITMGLRSMDWDEWIELDNHYLKFHADKTRRITERGHKCCKTDPSDPRVFDGAVELLEELADYLPQRYPSMFRNLTATCDANDVRHERSPAASLACVAQKLQRHLELIDVTGLW